MDKVKRILALAAVVFAVVTVVSLFGKGGKKKGPAVVAGGTFVCLIIKLIAAINKLSEAISNVTKGVFLTAAEIITGAVLKAGALNREKKAAVFRVKE